MNTLLYKNISLTLYSRRVNVGCVGEGSWRRGQTSTYWPSNTSFSTWLFNRGSLRAQSPLSATGSHFGIMSPTDSNSNWNWLKPSVAPGYILSYIHLLPLFLRLFTQVHLLIDGSVEGQYVTSTIVGYLMPNPLYTYILTI